MSHPSLPLRLVFVFSFSLTTSYSLSRSPPSSLKPPKATPSDLLALLGTKLQASKINTKIAQDLRSCLKFLVPFTPSDAEFKHHRIMMKSSRNSRREEGKDQLIRWPPEPVMELARLAFDSGGDPAAIHRLLDPTMMPVPDVEGSKGNHCELTRTPYGRRFINEDLNSYLEFLFKLIVERGPAVGLNVSLNRYDFFHGHLFLALDSGRLGILFHAKEYPACNKVFPYNMGYCQKGSIVTYDESMNLRNILWLAPVPSNSSEAWAAPGVLVVLDAHPGGIIYTDIIPDYVKFARTIYEDDFGEVVVDVNYLNVEGLAANYLIFIC